MKKPIKIDFVSDVSCPWCAIGLQSLQTALQRLDGELDPSLTFQPFELNPQMVTEGEDITEHLNKKYGSTPEQAAAARENIRARGEALGFTFNMDKRGRIYNTFNAHRLLHWAETEGEGKQVALKKALLTAYFTEGENPSDSVLLVRVAASVGLDAARAQGTTVIGLSFHVGSQAASPAMHVLAVEACAGLITAARAAGHALGTLAGMGTLAQLDRHSSPTHTHAP